MIDGKRPGGAQSKKKRSGDEKTARVVAARALLRVDEGAYSNLTMEGLCAAAGLETRESAFASALFYTTLERRLTIDHILKNYSAKPLDSLAPEVLASLRLGVCQMLYLEGVDDHAAVNESVELTRILGVGQASGFVNGVLRTFLRAAKKIPSVKGGKGDRLSVEYSCPRWLVKRLLKAYGDEVLPLLEASLGKPPLFLHANALFVTAESLVTALAAEGVSSYVQTDTPGCVLIEGRAVVEKLEAFQKGYFHVQDKSSQLCALALEAKPGERVLDVCSAPGGKAFTIAESMDNRGELIALDLHEKRAQLVAEGAARLGLTMITAKTGDASAYDDTLGIFDRVLCDVPCSGFGIIRRKPEIKYKTPESVENLPELQYKIVNTAAQYLKPGGTMVYSTCTLLQEENFMVVERFLALHNDFHLKSQMTRLDGNCDGFYTAVLVKKETF